MWKGSKFKALAEMLGYQIEDPPAFWEAPAILPKRFRYLAFKAYQREIISLAKLAELLREDVFDLRGKVEAAHSPPARSEDAT